MKRINVKKLVAVAAGAALVGAGVAPMAIASAADLQKSDVYDAAGSPIVNVLVGAKAKGSDVIWAGNIASKLAENAVTDKVSTGSGTPVLTNSQVKVQVGGGTVNYANAKELKDYMFSVVTPLENDFDRNSSIDVNGNITGTTLTKSQVADLTDKTISYKYNGSNTNITVKERLQVAANPRFNTNVDVERLALDIDADAFGYIVDLGNGIPAYTTATSTTDFTDGTDDHVLIPFLGKNYLVKDIGNTSGSEFIKLVETNAKTTLEPGESVKVEGKGTYAGKELDLVVDLLSSSGSTARFVLKDGDTTVQTVTQGAGDLDFTDNAGNDIMDTTVTIDSVTATGSNNTTGVTNGYVNMFVGSSGLTIYDSKGYPYDSSNSTGIYDWQARLYFSTSAGTAARKLKAIKIYNDNHRWIDEAALAVGETAEFVGGSYKIKFTGWKDDKAITTIKIGDNKLIYKDEGGSSHTIPFYIEGSASDDSWSSFAFDTKTIFYKVDKTDTNVGVVSGQYVNGRTWTIANGTGAGIADMNISGSVPDGSAGTLPIFFAPSGVIAGTAQGRANVMDINSGGIFKVDGTTFTMTGKGGTSASSGIIYVKTDGYVTFRKTSNTGDIIYTGGDTNTNNATYGKIYYTDASTFDPVDNTAQLALEGANSKTFNYAVRVREAQNKLYLLLDDQTFDTEFSGNIKRVQLTGTDLGENGVVDADTKSGADANYQYYFPNNTTFHATAGNTDNVYVAHFKLDTGDPSATSPSAGYDGTYDWNVYIETVNHKTADVSSGSKLSGYSYEVERLGTDTGTHVQAINLRSDTPGTYYSEAYADDGTWAGINGRVVTFNVPETRPYITASVQSEGTTETVVGGEEEWVDYKGDSVTIGGVKINVTDINGVTVSGTTGGASYKARAPLNGYAQVEAVSGSSYAGAAVVVGGFKVNSVANALDASQNLAKAGDCVVEKEGDKILVAGWTAADTVKAARDFINFLDGSTSTFVCQ